MVDSAQANWNAIIIVYGLGDDWQGVHMFIPLDLII
jgi:hypothetical protein